MTAVFTLYFVHELGAWRCSIERMVDSRVLCAFNETLCGVGRLHPAARFVDLVETLRSVVELYEYKWGRGRLSVEDGKLVWRLKDENRREGLGAV
jgi:hypothetical protein